MITWDIRFTLRHRHQTGTVYHLLNGTGFLTEGINEGTFTPSETKSCKGLLILTDTDYCIQWLAWCCVEAFTLVVSGSFHTKRKRTFLFIFTAKQGKYHIPNATTCALVWCVSDSTCNSVFNKFSVSFPNGRRMEAFLQSISHEYCWCETKFSMKTDAHQNKPVLYNHCVKRSPLPNETSLIYHCFGRSFPGFFFCILALNGRLHCHVTIFIFYFSRTFVLFVVPLIPLLLLTEVVVLNKWL